MAILSTRAQFSNGDADPLSRLCFVQSLQSLTDHQDQVMVVLADGLRLLQQRNTASTLTTCVCVTLLMRGSLCVDHTP